MRKTYQVLAYTIAVLVVVQAGAIAWAFFGLSNWVINDGGVVNKQLIECTDCDMQFTAEWGFAIHMFFNGLLLIPLVSLILLLVSFFAHVPRGVPLALIVVGLVALQVIGLPALARQVGSGFGGLHGVNAFVLMGVALMAGRKASARSIDSTTAEPVTA